MKKRSVNRSIFILIVALIGQAVLLKSTETELRISSELRRVYIYEGDLISDKPPETADRASRTVKNTWEACRYWNGLTIKNYLLPPGNCPLMTPP